MRKMTRKTLKKHFKKYLGGIINLKIHGGPKNLSQKLDDYLYKR